MFLVNKMLAWFSASTYSYTIEQRKGGKMPFTEWLWTDRFTINLVPTHPENVLMSQVQVNTEKSLIEPQEKKTIFVAGNFPLFIAVLELRRMSRKCQGPDIR